MSLMSFRKAEIEEAELIVRLVNSAYRGDSSRVGWTTEADYLDGQRTDEQEIQSLIQAETSMILLCLQADEIIGSVLLEKKSAGSAYLGMFVVKPDLQGGGIGKHFLQAAEDSVQQEWGVTKMTMSVITLRTELFAFYERRGYRRTGELLPFPDDPRKGIQLVQNLQFEILEKYLRPVPKYKG